MALKLKGNVYPKLGLQGKVYPKISQERVAQALGAQPVGERTIGYVDPFHVRETLRKMVRSTGGRPGIADSKQRKIPVPESDWSLIEVLAKNAHAAESHTAAAVIHYALTHFRMEVLEEYVEHNNTDTKVRVRTKTG